MLSLHLLKGEAAIAWAQEHQYAWNMLLKKHEWSTPYISPEFSISWWLHYAHAGEALVIFAHAPCGELRGVFPLVLQRRIIKGVGTHQAEYQGWVCQGSDLADFTKAAFDLLAEHYPHHHLELRYIHDPRLIALLRNHEAALGKRTLLRTYRRPIIEVHNPAVTKAMRKKGNKSKLSRLRRLGALRFQRLHSADELEAVLDEIVAAYDLRQGAQYDLMRFTDDPLKAPFHLDWMRQAPEQFYITTMMLGERVAAAMICVRSQDELHLAMSCYRPELSAHSPGRLLIYETARMAAADGLQLLDLTPGGDAWKDSMATTYQPAAEAMIHASSLQAQMRRPREHLRSILRDALWNRGLPPHQIKQFMIRELRRVPERVAMQLKSLGAPQPSYLIYHIDPSTLQHAAAPTGLAVGSLEAVNRFAAALPRSRRQEFLSSALNRLAAGERVYTLERDGGIISLGWLAELKECHFPKLDERFTLPQPAPVVLDMSTIPTRRGRGYDQQLLASMLRDVAEAGWRDAYATTCSDAPEYLHILEKIGFQLLAQLDSEPEQQQITESTPAP